VDLEALGEQVGARLVVGVAGDGEHLAGGAGDGLLTADEATCSLDLRSEATIERALDNVLEGRTAIIIAHRLSTAMRADRIAVVNDGRIVELGSHDDLVAQGGIYAGMYATWVSHMTEAS
jgi:ATP-binding cassette subfamily B protein